MRQKHVLGFTAMQLSTFIFFLFLIFSCIAMVVIKTHVVSFLYETRFLICWMRSQNKLWRIWKGPRLPPLLSALTTNFSESSWKDLEPRVPFHCKRWCFKVWVVSMAPRWTTLIISWNNFHNSGICTSENSLIIRLLVNTKKCFFKP